MKVEIEDWVARLAAELLREYAERQGNDGCNDYEVPEYVPKDQLQSVIEDWNTGPPEDSEGLSGVNWAVTEAVAQSLSKAVKP